jgi:lipopolysaccharide export system protein LptA
MESIYFSDGIKLLKSDGTVVVASKAFYNSDKYELLLEDDVIISKDDYIVRANEVTYYGEIKLLKLTGE